MRRSCQQSLVCNSHKQVGSLVCGLKDKRSTFTHAFIVRAYNCQGQLCPSGSGAIVEAVYRRFNTAAVDAFANQ